MSILSSDLNFIANLFIIEKKTGLFFPFHNITIDAKKVDSIEPTDMLN